MLSGQDRSHFATVEVAQSTLRGQSVVLVGEDRVGASGGRSFAFAVLDCARLRGPATERLRKGMRSSNDPGAAAKRSRMGRSHALDGTVETLGLL